MAGTEQTSQTNNPIILSPEQLSELTLKLSERTIALEQALNAKGVIDNATPTKPGIGGLMQSLQQPNVVEKIIGTIEKLLSGPSETDPRLEFLENIKNQLLYQKLGMIIPAPTQKVNIV